MLPEVVYFHRKPRVCSYSLEFHFSDVRTKLKDRIDARLEVVPFYSAGIFKRIGILLFAWWKKGQINHVTGDISFLPLALRGSKVVLTIPDCGEHRNRSGLIGWLFKKLWIDWPVNCSTMVTTISEASKRDIIAISGCAPDKVRVIPVAVSENFVFAPKLFHPDSLRILQVGTSANKNLENVILALSGMDCTLAIIGELSQSQRQLLEKHKIRFENHVGLSTAAVAEQYRQADIVVFASHFEGFGMPIIESQSVGRPVIAGNNSSMPEVGGDGAHFVDSCSVDEIRSAIVRIIEDEAYRNRLVALGRENAKRFDPSRIAEAYYEIYTNL